MVDSEKSNCSLLMLGLFLLTGCSGEEEKTFDLTTKDLETRIGDALKEMGDKTKMKVFSDVTEDGKPVIVLSENIMIIVEETEGKVAKVTLGAMPDAFFTEKEDLMLSFMLLVGTVDDSLSFGQRNILINELGLKEANLMDYGKVHSNNGIEYTYKGDKDNMLLQAKPE